MVRARSVFLAACVAALLALTGLTGTSAVAAAAPTISVKIVDPAGKPIRGVSLYVYETGGSGRSDFVGSSWSDGTIRQATSSLLRSGTVTLVYLDSAETFVPLVVSRNLTTGDNDQGVVTLGYGAEITGRVRTPAGLKLDSAQVVAVPVGVGPRAKPYFDSDAFTAPDGLYRLTGVPAGTYRVSAGYGAWQVSEEVVVPAATGRTPAPLTNVDLVGVRALPDVQLKGKARSNSSVYITAFVTTDVGVLYPYGRAAVYDNGRRVTGIYTLTKHPGSGYEKKFTLKNLKKGNHRFQIKYYGSSEVLPGWSPTTTFRAR